MKIDDLKEQDLESMLKLANELGYPTTLNCLQDRFKSVKENSNSAMFVARSTSEKIVGFIQVTEEPCSLLGGIRANIAALIVDEEFRGKGIGSALLKRAEEWSKTTNLSLIRVRSNVIREDAHQFYTKCGYENPKSWKLFTKKLV